MSPAKKAATGRSGASSKTKKTTARGSSVKKTAARKTSAKKAPVRAAKKSAATRTAPKKSVAKKTAKKTVKKSAAKKTVAKKTPIKKTPIKKTTVTKASAAKTTTAPSARAKPAIKKPVTRPAPPAPPKKKVRAAKFTPDQLKKIKDSLGTKRVELEQRQRELDEASFTSTQSEITGEVGIDEDFADAGTATFERERDLSIRNNIRDLIDQVTRAVERIDERKYGTCERCGQPIDATRLRELPHAALCLDCKRREERAR